MLFRISVHYVCLDGIHPRRRQVHPKRQQFRFRSVVLRFWNLPIQLLYPHFHTQMFVVPYSGNERIRKFNRVFFMRIRLHQKKHAGKNQGNIIHLLLLRVMP